MAAQTDQLKVYVIAMMSIGAKVLEEMEKSEKPLTSRQTKSQQMEAKIMEQLLVRGASRKSRKQ